MFLPDPVLLIVDARMSRGQAQRQGGVTPYDAWRIEGTEYLAREVHPELPRGNAVGM